MSRVNPLPLPLPFPDPSTGVAASKPTVPPAKRPAGNDLPEEEIKSLTRVLPNCEAPVSGFRDG